MDIAKDSVKRVTNEDLLAELVIMKKDIEAIKARTGFKDRPIGMPEKRNYNRDPGLFSKEPAVA